MFTIKHVKNRDSTEELMHMYCAEMLSLSDNERVCSFHPFKGGDVVHINMQAGDRLIIENGNGRTTQIIDQQRHE